MIGFPCFCSCLLPRLLPATFSLRRASRADPEIRRTPDRRDGDLDLGSPGLAGALPGHDGHRKKERDASASSGRSGAGRQNQGGQVAGHEPQKIQEARLKGRRLAAASIANPDQVARGKRGLLAPFLLWQHIIVNAYRLIRLGCDEWTRQPGYAARTHPAVSQQSSGRRFVR